LVNGVRDITVDNCTFANLTADNGNHQHMIYASHDVVGVVVTNCAFQDCLADYLRFRDNSEYCVVDHCTFTSTMTASAWPFISAELYNETNADAAGNEFFGSHFQVTSNSFTYNVSGGAGPYSSLHFSDTGFSPYTYNCALTSSQASLLGSSSAGFQQAFLQANMGINAADIKMFGNTYDSPRSYYRMDYGYVWDGTAPWNNWQGIVDISSAPDSSGALLDPLPVLRNGNFDRQGLMLTPAISSEPNQSLFQTWFCNSYANILSHPGFNETSNALRFNKAATQYVYQWITPPGPAWTMDCLFAMGSGFSGVGTKFKVDIFHDDISGSKVSVGVNDQGQIGIYNNAGALIPIPELGTVSFSQDNNNNGYYNDPGDVLNVYRLRIVGNYAASTPYVNVYTSDANNPALTHQSLGLTSWVNGTPVNGLSAPETIAFYNYTNTVIVDQIAFASGLAGQPPVITGSALLNGGQFVLSGTNGFAGDKYYLFSSTNLASGNWALETINTFDANGAFSATNTVTPGAPQKFYRFQLQ
jgi:hypothetical protein